MQQQYLLQLVCFLQLQVEQTELCFGTRAGIFGMEKHTKNLSMMSNREIFLGFEDLHQPPPPKGARNSVASPPSHESIPREIDTVLKVKSMEQTVKLLFRY
jgi:hypothetical protein